MKERLKEFLSNKKSGKFLVVFGIIGIVLIYISSLLPQGDSEKAEEKTENTYLSVLEYREYLENEIKKIVTAISGDTSSVVAITLDSEITYVYADETKQNNQTASGSVAENREQTYIIVTDSEGGEKPLIVTAYMPKVRGVAIVCSAKDPDVIENIEGAVMAALDITKRKIFISDKKGE